MKRYFRNFKLLEKRGTAGARAGCLISVTGPGKTGVGNRGAGLSLSRDEQGFSLIDALVAVVLFVGGVIAFASFTGGVMNRNSSNEMTSVAVALAEERIEDLKRKAINEVIGDADDGASTVTVSGIPYTVTTDVSNGGVGNLVDVSVTVTWADNLPSSYSLNTRIHQN